MNCVFCNQENPDSALFCKKCGRRLDGMSLCAHCGKLTPADGEYCIYCGSNRNAPVYEFPRVTVTPEDGAEDEGYAARQVSAAQVAYPEPASAAGPVAAAAKPSAAGRRAAEQHVKKPRVYKINTAALTFAGDACAVLAALVAVIFVFLIGTVITVDTNGVSVSDGNVTSIFYYFGDAYDAIAALAAGSTYAEYALTVGTALTTVCAALALLGTVVMFILTAVRYIKRLTRRTEKPVTAYAVGTYVAYLCGTALFMACVANSAGIEFVTTFTSLSGASVAGIVIGAVAVVACAVLKMLCTAKSAGARTLVFNGVCCGAIAALIFAVIGLSGRAVAELASSGGLVEGTSGHGIIGIFGTLVTKDAFDSVYAGELIISIIFIAAMAALSVCAVLCVPRLFDFAHGARDGRMLGLIYGTGACGIAAGILRLVASSVLAGGLSTENLTYSAGVAVGVVIIVLSVLIVAAAMVYKILGRKYSENLG